jgi:CheY-like chemotaxis protein/HPt (histidine-containing phosphotransfer) domain-containing protein
MSNEFLQVIVITVAIVVAIVVVYLIFKRSPAPQPHSNAPEKNDIPQVATQDDVTVVPEKKEESKTLVYEEILNDLTSRRKSDNTIQKRSVPEHGKITKQNFSEFAGERILVAEDNIINQKVLLGLLAESGIELVVANDGQEALDILENDTNFLMILMDAHMPRVDGFEATRIIRANPKFDHIVVVALSGDTSSDDIQKMKNAGMAEQLEKPLRMESLYKIIYAYSTKETQQETAVTNILDVDEGVQICGGDENFYREILSEFISDYGDSADRLGELLRAHDMHGADALLLDIVGVTANIGAYCLGDIASDLKRSLSDTHEKSYFSLYDQYKVQLERLTQEIRAYL